MCLWLIWDTSKLCETVLAVEIGVIRMTKINEYKKALASNEKAFLEEYEPSINELLNKLKTDGLLNTLFTPEEIERRQKLIATFNVPYQLYGNAYKFFKSGDEKIIENNIKKLESLELGLDTKDANHQFITILCHLYQVTLERFRFHLMTLIDITSLNLPETAQLNRLLKKLNHDYPGNKFIEYFSTQTRNAIAHYSYFVEGENIYLCNSYYEPAPDSIKLEKFRIETINLSILTVAFFNIFLDKYGT